MPSTFNTVADYIADVRVLLQDIIVPYRYPDQDLVTALNLCLADAYRMRPDLFLWNGLSGTDNSANDLPVYSLAQYAGVAANDLDPVPIEGQFNLAIEYGIVAHALARDQEDIQDARSSLFMGAFVQMLVGPALPAPSIAARGGK